jgi:hypothetical protein
MDYNQLVFQLLFYTLIFYTGLCLVFFLFIGVIQAQVYATTVQNKVRPDLLKILGENDSNGEIKVFSKTYANALRDLSIRYSSSSNSNSGMNIALICIGILLVLVILIPGYMLYQNGIRFGYKAIIWNALGFYFLMVCFGIYFFIRVLSRYSPILPSELIQMVITGGQRLID